MHITNSTERHKLHLTRRVKLIAKHRLIKSFEQRIYFLVAQAATQPNHNEQNFTRQIVWKTIV